MTRESEKIGQVCLVGAGPGDPALITVAGVERLRQAEVVVYDALANPLLLDLAPPDALRLDAGKRAREHKLTQDQIHELLLEHARAGRYVVRLKGGDPYLFGRGAEEVAYLARHGVACEVIPGITAGIAAPAAAGIPVTHRKLASTVTFVTGHEEPGKEASAVNFAALAGLIQAGGTVCFYMGVGRLQTLAEALTSAGLSPDTACAVVQWGTLPRQRSVRSTLARAAADVAAAGLGAPAIIIVGPVAAIDEPGLDWFIDRRRRPLMGQRIVVTRTRQQVSDLRRRLEALGAEVLEAPTIRIIPPPSWDAVDQVLRDIRSFDWLLLTSAQAVQVIAERFEAMRLDARQMAGVRLAVVGQATAESLRQQLGLRADLVPSRFVAEALADELIAGHDVSDKRLLLLQADIARPILTERLRQAGAQVSEVTVYQTKLADGLDPAIAQALRDGAVDWVTFTSASTARNLVELLGSDRDALRKARLASIGPITSAALGELGLQVAVEAQPCDIPSLIDAIAQAVTQDGFASPRAAAPSRPNP